MIGEKRSFSFISPIVKLIICRVHDQYVEKKIVWFQKFSIPPPLPQNKLNFWAFENPPPTPPPAQEFPIPSVEGVWIFSGATP